MGAPTAFPLGLDNPLAINDPVDRNLQMAAALAAIEAKVGIDASAVAGTVDIKLRKAAQFTTAALVNATTLAAGLITGALMVVLANTANGALAITTRTAAQMFADHGAQVGQTYLLRIYNSGDNTITLTGGTGVTITGTATIATAKFRDYIVTFDSATTLTMQNVGNGTAS